jgi:hypothetical protein
MKRLDGQQDMRSTHHEAMVQRAVELMTRTEGATFAQLWSSLRCSRRVVYRVLEDAERYGTIYRVGVGIGQAYRIQKNSVPEKV